MRLVNSEFSFKLVYLCTHLSKVYKWTRLFNFLMDWDPIYLHFYLSVLSILQTQNCKYTFHLVLCKFHACYFKKKKKIHACHKMTVSPDDLIGGYSLNLFLVSRLLRG